MRGTLICSNSFSSLKMNQHHKSCQLYSWSRLPLKRTLLEVNRITDGFAQAYTHTQRYLNNAWSEMVSCSLCFGFYHFSSFHWFIQTIWYNSYPSLDQRCSPILTSTSCITILLTTSNLIVYLLHFYFASNQRLLNPLSLLMLDVYSLQVVWIAHPLLYFPLDIISNRSFGSLVSL